MLTLTFSSANWGRLQAFNAHICLDLKTCMAEHSQSSKTSLPHEGAANKHPLQIHLVEIDNCLGEPHCRNLALQHAA